ncbi:hypothetical protein [Chryseobacterium defluvii]|uniref:Uncharacterized protein n=1 Tax=Chryseobacterium defluvii TaxID=160396 RepID=A0A495SLJ1_9FLAO|nr:hypothetical protein [Chryseobacterium defluvii]RKT01108.1 hypothetical protein BCF58_0322 [Chryseobacterium defluvii]
MNEVKYYLNGKYFKDFGVYVSESNGIVDSLERKPIQQYDWSEYHGLSPDLTSPKYKERKFELKCFIIGDNWEIMFDNFKDFLIKEFSKPGTQRLHIEPFEFKVLPYEVYMMEEIKIEKRFKQGNMVGVFNLILIEPNPIKKILKTNLDTFHLSYECSSETEIFLGDGTKLIGRGNVSFTKDYSAPSYQGSGINIIQQSAINNNYYELYVIPSGLNHYLFSLKVSLSSAKDMNMYLIGKKPDNTYHAVAISETFSGAIGENEISLVKELDASTYSKFYFKVLDTEGNEISGSTFTDPRIETAEVIGEWQNMLGKEKIIIIAGNVDDIKNLSTEAEIIWNKI